MQLSEYLSRENMSQTEFAEKVGVSKVMVSCLVRGTKTPSGLLARKIEVLTGGEVMLSDWYPSVDLPDESTQRHSGHTPSTEREVAHG